MKFCIYMLKYNPKLISDPQCTTIFMGGIILLNYYPTEIRNRMFTEHAVSNTAKVLTAYKKKLQKL